MSDVIVVRRGGEPTPWTPPEPTAQTGFDAAFWGRVLDVALPLTDRKDLTWFVSWADEELPRYGDDVVAILPVCDDAKTPAWSHRVRATFKAGGVRPEPRMQELRTNPLAMAGTAYLQARVIARHRPGAKARAALRAEGRPLPPVVPVPLGYANQIDVPLPPVDERPWAVTFAGSVQHWEGWWGTLTAALGAPKVRARRQMLEALDRLAARHPELAVHHRVTAAFTNLSPVTGGHDMAETEWYSRLLADSRIVLAPRGTNLETFRLYEGMRAGCVVVCDVLPRRPYLEGAPILELGRWSRLEEVVLPLLRDPQRLADLSAASRRFWEERVGEQAVGRGIAAVLNRIP